MTIKPVDVAVEVWICDNCLDEATPSKVKTAYMKRQAEVDELIKRAAAMGLHFAQELPGTKKQTQAVTPQVAAPQAEPAPKLEPISEGSRIVDGRTADKQLRTNINGTVDIGSGAIAGGGDEYEIRSETTASVDLKAGERAEIAMVEGRLGTQVAIPVKRVGPSGTTEVRIIKTGGDIELQNRFKNMAQSDVQFSKKYDVRFVRCALCNGTGQAMGKTCPKCNGIGEIQVSSF